MIHYEKIRFNTFEFLWTRSTEVVVVYKTSTGNVLTFVKDESEVLKPAK